MEHSTQRRLLLATCVLAFACAFAAAAVAVYSIHGLMDARYHLGAPQSRIYLPVTQHERLRVVDLESDGSTPRSARIELDNHNTRFLEFQNGVLRRNREFYPDPAVYPPVAASTSPAASLPAPPPAQPTTAPTADELAHRQIASDLIFDSSGKRQSEATFTPQGVPTKVGHRLDNGTYDRSTFWDNGKTVHLHQILRPDGSSALAEQSYRVTGIIEHAFQDTPAGDLSTSFDAQGVRLEQTLTAKDGGVVTTKFFPGGAKTRLIVEAKSDHTNAQLFNEAGEVVQTRLLDATSMTVTVLDHGSPLYQQVWRNSSSGMAEPQWVMTSLTVFQNGTRRVYTFYTDGNTPMKVELFKGDATTPIMSEDLREDGTIHVVTAQDQTGAPTHTEYSVEDNKREEIAPELRKLPPFSDNLPIPQPVYEGYPY